MKALTKYLKFVESGCNLTLTTDAGGVNLILRQETPKGQVEMLFQLLNIDVQPMEIPAIDYAAKIVLSSNRFAKLIKDMRQIDETVQIKAAKNTAKFVINGPFGKIDLQLAHNEHEIAAPDARTKIETTKNANVDSQFALNQIDLFARAAHLCTFTTLGLSPN